jgi:capsular exopolysaccharide synthesis family protein
MSRIHEALAKAAREKNKLGSSGVAPALIDIATGVHYSAQAGEAESFAEAARILEAPAPERPHEEFKKATGQLKWRLDPRVDVFAPESKQKIGAERFRTLRSRLYQISETRKLRSVLVTSGIPSEGKSFVCANLAQSLVHRQTRSVLIIDADLRLPTQHKLFGASRTPGLTNYLQGELDENRVIQKGMDSNVFLIPAGDDVKNPSELLLNDKMKALLKFGVESFDWVIVDSPPSLPVHDSSLLADLCDGVLFVIRAASTDYELAAKGCAEFRKKNLLGVVFNGVDPNDTPYHSYYQE